MLRVARRWRTEEPRRHCQTMGLLLHRRRCKVATLLLLGHELQYRYSGSNCDGALRADFTSALATMGSLARFAAAPKLSPCKAMSIRLTQLLLTICSAASGHGRDRVCAECLTLFARRMTGRGEQRECLHTWRVAQQGCTSLPSGAVWQRGKWVWVGCTGGRRCLLQGRSATSGKEPPALVAGFRAARAQWRTARHDRYR